MNIKHIIEIAKHNKYAIFRTSITGYQLGFNLKCMLIKPLSNERKVHQYVKSVYSSYRFCNLNEYISYKQKNQFLRYQNYINHI